MKRIDNRCKCCGSELSVYKLIEKALPLFKKQAFTINDMVVVLEKPYEDVKTELRRMASKNLLAYKFVRLPSEAFGGRITQQKVYWILPQKKK